MQIRTPDWVKHSVFYQIFPDRFAKGVDRAAGVPRTRRLEDWSAPPTAHGYKGGNLWGVIERLDYLQDLGVSALYFNPIFESASNHRYHTHDYYRVDPLLGGDEAFDELLDAAHRRGIRVVLDGVFSHVGRGFFFFNDIIENGPLSPWLDWFTVHDWPLSPYDASRPSNYASWKNNRALPQFNHAHAEVREYLMRVAEHWVRRGIDGWRLDEPRFVYSPDFWQEFRARVKSINPDAYIVGEEVGEPDRWLDGTQFDGVTNYQFTTHAIRFVSGGRLRPEYLSALDGTPFPVMGAREYAGEIELLLRRHAWEIQLTQFNFLSSHDTARVLTVAGGDEAAVELAAVLLLTYPGAPCIFYGDEVGLEGGRDPDCRRGFPPEGEWNRRLADCHRRLIALRRDSTALRTGGYQTLFAQGDAYGFARVAGDEEVIVAVNVGDGPASVEVGQSESQAGGGLRYRLKSRPDKTLYGGGRAAWHGGPESHVLRLSLPPRGCIVLGVSQ